MSYEECVGVDECCLNFFSQQLCLRHVRPVEDQQRNMRDHNHFGETGIEKGFEEISQTIPEVLVSIHSENGIGDKTSSAAAPVNPVGMILVDGIQYLLHCLLPTIMFHSL